MRPYKWLSLLLALSLLAAMLSAAMAEETEIEANSVEFEQIESEIPPAEYVDGDTGLSVELEYAPEDGENELPLVDYVPEEPSAADETGGDYMVEAPVADRFFACVTAGEGQVYSGTDVDELVAALAAGETVLVTGGGAARIPVAFNAEGSVVEGYMDSSDIAPLDALDLAAYMDAAASAGVVALYEGDLNWPLVPLGADSYAGEFGVMATSRYTDLGNDTRFTINGKEIYANMFPDTGEGNCWAWAQKVYQALWGYKFTATFEGNASTGMNLLRNLSDDERKLTPEHLKEYAQSVKLGATLRVSSCTSSCPEFQNDGLSCGHKGHSLIIVGVSKDGITTMDSHSNSQHTRFYSWEGFCNSWKNYTYIKYIKWPNAPALPPTQFVDGIGVKNNSATYRVRAIAKNGVNVVTTPMVTTLQATMKYPETFAVTKKSTAKIDGSYWLYGTTESGITGWVAAKDDMIMDVNETIHCTRVTLDQKSMILATGGTGTLKPNVEPVDATDKSVTWKSDNEAVATVANGVVTGVVPGTATITVTTTDSGMTRSCEVVVTNATCQADVTKTGGNGIAQVELGQKLQISPVVVFANDWKIKSVTSSKTKIATVSKQGIVTPKALGKTTITITTKNRKKVTLTVQVIKPVPEEGSDTEKSVDPTAVKLNKSGTVKLKKGKKLKLTAILTPSNAASALTWKSSNAKVATVDDDGNVTAVKKGTCYIAVKTANGKLAKVKIKVT